MAPVFTLISPTVLLTICAVLAACSVVAALVLLRHLTRVEARLRAMEAVPADRQTPVTWLATAERLVGRLTPMALRFRVRRRLLRAQLAGRITPEQLILLAVVLACGGATLTMLTNSVGAGFLLFPIYLVLTSVVLSFWLDRRAVQRRDRVQNSLPATLDMLVLAMEAGLSLDAALREVVVEWHSAASREFERVATLTRLGMSRGEALREIAESIDLETLRRLAARLSAAERLGTSAVLILRAEAEEARRERRTIATRKISQAPTKILIPTALLILPVTLIVLLGPALPQVLRIASG